MVLAHRGNGPPVRPKVTGPPSRLSRLPAGARARSRVHSAPLHFTQKLKSFVKTSNCQVFNVHGISASRRLGSSKMILHCSGGSGNTVFFTSEHPHTTVDLRCGPRRFLSCTRQRHQHKPQTTLPPQSLVFILVASWIFDSGLYACPETTGIAILRKSP